MFLKTKKQTDMIPSHAQRVFQYGPLPQGHCFRQCVNEGKTHDRCSNHFIDVSMKTIDKRQMKHYYKVTYLLFVERDS